MWIALVMAVVGLIILIWPEGLARGRTHLVTQAVRIGGGLLIIGALLLALAEG